MPLGFALLFCIALRLGARLDAMCFMLGGRGGAPAPAVLQFWVFFWLFLGLFFADSAGVAQKRITGRGGTVGGKLGGGSNLRVATGFP